MTEDPMMVRQQELALDIPSGVAVVGCGGVGSWVALFLAMAGVKELYLFDDDIISDHNLNRLPATKEQIGAKKTVALAETIMRFRPDCNVLTMGRFEPVIADAARISSYCSWMVISTDTLASRKMISKWADKNAVAYIEAAAEGETGSVTGVPGDWSTPQETQPGYQSVPVWVGPCVIAATAAVYHVLHNSTLGDRTIRMGWQDFGFSIFDSEAKKEEISNE